MRSFVQIVQLYADGVYTFIERLLCNQEFSEQVAIEVFRFAWDNIQQVRMNSSFIAWLQGIALVNILEKYRNKNAILLSAEVYKPKYSVKVSDIDQLLPGLKFEERLIVVLYDIKKYSLDEIHDILPEFSLREIRALLDKGRFQISDGFRR